MENELFLDASRSEYPEDLKFEGNIYREHESEYHARDTFETVVAVYSR